MTRDEIATILHDHSIKKVDYRRNGKVFVCLSGCEIPMEYATAARSAESTHQADAVLDAIDERDTHDF